MAARLRQSSKTFARTLKENDGIPFVWSGKRKIFDPEKVEAYFAGVSQVAPSPQFVRKSRTQKSKFAEAVGL